MQTIENGMNDYNLIKISKKVEGMDRSVEHFLTPHDTVEFHKEDLEFLISEVSKAKEASEKVIIFTHHAPVMEATPPIYRNNKINTAFCTNLVEMMGPPIIGWFYGHTHR